MNDLTDGIRKDMRKSEHTTKACEVDPKRLARQRVSKAYYLVTKVTEEWQAGGKAKFTYLPPGYNNDPCMLRHTAGCSFYQGLDDLALNKSWVIDLELLAA